MVFPLLCSILFILCLFQLQALSAIPSNGRGSNIKINYQHLFYSFLGMSRIIYKIIKVFQNIAINILLFHVILYKNSTTNFEYRLLYDTMTFHVQLLK